MKSIWQDTVELKSRDTLKENLNTEVLIIGAGMTGILTAYVLMQEGLDVVVVEANKIGSGQTKNTTAKITYQHGLVYDKIRTGFGEERARQYARLNREAIDDFERIIQKEDIDCDFSRLPAYLYSLRDADLLHREMAVMRNMGIDVRFTKEIELPYEITGALKLDHQAQFHPLKFLKAMSEKIQIFENTNIQNVKENTAYTEDSSITADHIVYATHYPFINRPGYFFMRMHQQRSYVMSLENAMQLEGMYYGIDREASWSFRNQGSSLLMGGGAHRTGVIPDMDSYKKIKKEAVRLWPHCRESEFWSAQDCMPIDGIPYIGQFSNKRPGWHVATGFQKWGMSSAMVAARLITEQITGQSKSTDTIFHPGRFKASKSLPGVLREGLSTAKQFAKGISGKNPRCTHLGCGLEWNQFEETWECPCHGSRFDEEGKIADNPAQRCLCKPGGIR